MSRGKTKPSPTLSDYFATRAEQGCLQLGITFCGTVVALVVLVLGALLGVRELKVVAAIVFVVALAIGIFVGNDVNYGVARMRERAEENAKKSQDQ